MGRLWGKKAQGVQVHDGRIARTGDDQSGFAKPTSDIRIVRAALDDLYIRMTPQHLLAQKRALRLEAGEQETASALACCV